MTLKPYRVIILLLLLSTSLAYSQTREVLRLGVKETVPNQKIEALIANNEYNFIDAFEYELTKEVIKYIKATGQYDLEIVPVNQSDKLNEVISGKKIDALIFTFSETLDRKKKGIHFSKPYFQNKAIGLIISDETVSLKNLKTDLIRIGHVANTTSQKELNSLKNKYTDNLVLTPYNNHNELIKALKDKKIDAATGDVSRLIFDINNNDFHFGGNLPTIRSKIRDNYCFAITPNRKELVSVFDNFVLGSKENIENLKSKWLSTSLEDAYQSYYNKDETKLKNYIRNIAIGAVLALFLSSLIFYIIIKRKNKHIKDIEAGKTDIKLGEILSLYDAKGRANIDAEAICKIGCEFFNNAEKITYVGSGGFLSDKTHAEAWSKSLHGFLKRPNTLFERVIDLPEMEVNSDSEICLSKTKNFFPSYLEKDYISRYIKWLCIQYSNLKNYNNINIIDSRGAALWGYGIVIIIKDETEVLIFTTNKNTKIGSTIRDQKLAKQISTVISDIIEIGKDINIESLKDMFFMEDPRLINLISKIDKLDKKDLDQDTMKEINLTALDIQRSCKP